MLTIAETLILTIIKLLVYALFFSAVISTLMAFNVLDSRNRFVWSVSDFLYRVTEPMLRPIRAVLPTFGAVDLSPWIAMLLLQLVVAPLVAVIFDSVRFGSVQPLLQ